MPRNGALFSIVSFSANSGECVVERRGLELRARHAVRANRSLKAERRTKPQNSGNFPYGSRCLAGKQVVSVGHVVAERPVTGLPP